MKGLLQVARFACPPPRGGGGETAVEEEEEGIPPEGDVVEALERELTAKASVVQGGVKGGEQEKGETGNKGVDDKKREKRERGKEKSHGVKPDVSKCSESVCSDVPVSKNEKKVEAPSDSQPSQPPETFIDMIDVFVAPTLFSG